MSAGHPILIVEDDVALREILIAQIANDGEFAAIGAASIQDATTMLTAPDARYDAIILDVGLPDGDGRDLCARLRNEGHQMPIIMLTGADDDADVVRGFEVGANDYIAKPYRLGELLARLRAQVRGFEHSENVVLTIGPYTFRPGAKMLHDPATKRRIRLTDKETTTLKFLYRAGNRPVSREVLLSEVWGYGSGITTHTLETHIYRLRQKIEPDPRNPQLVVTEPQACYRLDPDRLPPPKALVSEAA